MVKLSPKEISVYDVTESLPPAIRQDLKEKMKRRYEARVPGWPVYTCEVTQECIDDASRPEAKFNLINYIKARAADHLNKVFENG